ncbi:MAG: alpha/beta hydrolase [Candidatus Daviesbacteria bacterium]|nr:alpha/beta hydrolase [Candidatus Daviesbacteria bacterium]
MAGGYFTSFDGAKIYYHKTTRDKNKWLVFLHGFGGDLTAWKKERTYFTRLGISTIAMDLRGHGLSERSNNENFYKLENFSKDVASLVKKEGLANPVVIGHCFGGMVAIYFQAQFPKVSKGLVLIDTSFKPPFFSYNPVEKTFFKHLINLILKFVPDIKTSGHAHFEKFIGTTDLDIRRLSSDILHTSLRSYLLMSENLVGLNAKKLLDKITVPTLVIEGIKDIIFPPEIARYLAKRIKGSELDFIERANHIIVINNPADLEKSIETFLKKINFI